MSDRYVSASELAKIPIRKWDRELCRCYVNAYPIGTVIEHRNRYYVGYGWRNVMNPSALNPSWARVGLVCSPLFCPLCSSYD